MRVAVVGAGVGGLAAAALLGRAGHVVTLFEATADLGGKSRRIVLDGQRVDTGPSIVTFPGVWRAFAARWRALGEGSGDGDDVAETALPPLLRLDELGTYHHLGEVVRLPVPEDHPWAASWKRYEDAHAPLAEDIERLLLAPPRGRETMGAAFRLLRAYGALTTGSVLDRARWLPPALREIIAIHTLQAGVGPTRAPSLFASLPAVVGTTGVFVPVGGVHEVVRALVTSCEAAGVTIETRAAVVAIGPGGVTVADRGHVPADAVVTDLDEERVQALLGGPAPRPGRRGMTCSGVSIYAVLDGTWPDGFGRHHVILPDDPEALHEALAAGRLPETTMVFVNAYPARDAIYPMNDKATGAILLTAPADGVARGLGDPWVDAQLARVERVLGLPGLRERLSTVEIHDPASYATWGSRGGALYGPIRPFWQAYLERLFVEERWRLVGIPLARVERILAAENYVRLFTDDGEHLHRVTLSALHALLDPAVFVRVNRSAIVQKDAIRELVPLGHGEVKVVLASGAEAKWTRLYRGA